MNCHLLCLLCFIIDFSHAWDCLGRCWVNPDLHVITSFHVQDYVEFWDCLSCPDASGCTDPSSPYIYNDACYTDTILQSCEDNTINQNVVLGPLLNISSPMYFCDNENSISCIDAFYRISSSERCIACTSTSPICGPGFYPVRCQKPQYGNSDCVPCTVPSLQNKTLYKYGFGLLYEPCMSKTIYGDIKLNSISHSDRDISYWSSFFQSCAFSHTPKWDEGYCSVECIDGYTMIQRPSHFLGYPDCVRCPTNCSLGSKIPTCLGQADVVTSDNHGECILCTNVLPPNSHWTGHDCSWECDISFFFADGFCLSCNTSQTSCDPYHYFMNCTHHNSGSCIPCFMECMQGYFMEKHIWENYCSCAPCNQPVLGQTYTIANCSSNRLYGHDTILGKCMDLCPIGFYKILNCTLTSNSVCAPCTPPKMGMLLDSRCSPLRDASYVPCPSNYSCNGSAYPQLCPLHLRPLNGFCECPLGMQFLDDICVPSFCGNGKYSDPITGNCLNCSDYQLVQRNLIVSPLSDPLIMGLNACFCPPQYFIHQETLHMTCVPCGDLNCNILDFETQTICNGRSILEPECVCSQPPGMNDTKCREGFICSEGYTFLNSTSLVWGEYNYKQFNFVYGSKYSKIFNSSFSFRPHKILLLNTDYSLSLVDGRIVLFQSNREEAAFLDISWIIGVNNEKRKSDVYITDINLHSRTDYAFRSDTFRIWISFLYQGFCGSFENLLQQCSAMELFSLLPQTTETDLTFCKLNLCFYWHPPGVADHLALTEGFTLHIKKFVFGRDEDLDMYVYALIQQHSIMKHKLVFSTSSVATGFDVVYSVPELERSVLHIIDITTGARGLYALMRRDEIAANLKVIQSRSYLVLFDLLNYVQKIIYFEGIEDGISLLSINYNLLFVQGLYENMIIDLWNEFRSSHFSDATKILSNSQITLSNWVPGPSGTSCILFDFATQSWILFAKLSMCLPDHISYAQEFCSLSLCLKKDPCGPYTYRDSGSNQCKCMPGYYMTFTERGSFLACTPCLASKNEYCEGGLKMNQLCPSFSRPLKDRAVSLKDCFCSPGFFKQQQVCIACTVNVFCPFDEMLIPIPCNHFGLTDIGQQVSPQSCFCPTRTWGLTCIPCGFNEICPILDLSTQGQKQPPLMEMWHVEFFGYVHNYLDFETCIKAYVQEQQDAYTIYIIPRGYSSGVDFISSSALIKNEHLIFFKLIVHLKQRDIYFQNNIDSCLRGRNALIDVHYDLIVNNFRPSLYREKINCGEKNNQPGFWEWNGFSDPSLEECTCIAGYEPVGVDEGRWRDSIKCYPCLNGTHRKQGSVGRCIPCLDKEREYAPYLAMSECICKPGYVKSLVSLRCELATKEYAAFYSKVPEWYSVMSVQFNVIIITCSISIVILILLSIFIYCIS